MEIANTANEDNTATMINLFSCPGWCFHIQEPQLMLRMAQSKFFFEEAIVLSTAESNETILIKEHIQKL